MAERELEATNKRGFQLNHHGATEDTESFEVQCPWEFFSECSVPPPISSNWNYSGGSIPCSL